MRALVAGGADPNALEAQRYDLVTIAAVRDDVATLELALALGTRPGNVTSPYAGTALIAAAHLGHVDVVRVLIDAGAPLDHVNNLGSRPKGRTLRHLGPARRVGCALVPRAAVDPQPVLRNLVEHEALTTTVQARQNLSALPAACPPRPTERAARVQSVLEDLTP